MVTMELERETGPREAKRRKLFSTAGERGKISGFCGAGSPLWLGRGRRDGPGRGKRGEMVV